MPGETLPEPPVPHPYKIVVGVDYSEPGSLAVRTALDLALHRDAQIYAITVAEGFGPGRPAEESQEMHRTFHDEAQGTLDRYLAGQLQELEKQTGALLNPKRIGAAVDFGKPADRILELAETVQADLIVVGTHGRSGIERLVLGSVATDVLKRASCPVLVARGKTAG